MFLYFLMIWLQLEEAEAEFVKGGGASEAVDMWLHAQQFARALTLVEQHAPEKVCITHLYSIN